MYINNQVTAIRNWQADPTFYSGFLDALDPNSDWVGGYHQAHELPQIELGAQDTRTYLHCHNCSADTVTGKIPKFLHMVGGVLGFYPYRHLAGLRYYGDAFDRSRFRSQDSKLEIEDLIPLANHKGVLYWHDLMKEAGVSYTDDPELARIVHAYIAPGQLNNFNPDASLRLDSAQLALSKLAEVNSKFKAVYGEFSPGVPRVWSQIQNYNPAGISYPMAGTENCLMSVGGWRWVNNLGQRIHTIEGGQNFVMLAELGKRNLLKKSVQGTYNFNLPYLSLASEKYSEEKFVSFGNMQNPNDIEAVSPQILKVIKPN